jgi:hypothetical protein
LLVIDHSGVLLEKEEHCYKYYNIKFYDDVINVKERFWETDSNKKHQRCQKGIFTEGILKLQIKSYLKKSGFAPTNKELKL